MNVRTEWTGGRNSNKLKLLHIKLVNYNKLVKKHKVNIEILVNGKGLKYNVKVLIVIYNSFQNRILRLRNVFYIENL